MKGTSVLYEPIDFPSQAHLFETTPSNVNSRLNSKELSSSEDRQPNLRIEDSNDSFLDPTWRRHSKPNYASSIEEVFSSSSSKIPSPLEVEVDMEEILSLNPRDNYAKIISLGNYVIRTVEQDITSRLFHDFGEDMSLPEENYIDPLVQDNPPTFEKLQSRADSQRSGGLEGWNYDSPFASVDVEVDNVDKFLLTRYVSESNVVLDRFLEEFKSRLATIDSENNPITSSNISRSQYAYVRTFLRESLLEKLKRFANRTLRARQQSPTTVAELMGLIALLVLCASYGESTTTLCSDEEEGHFLRLPFTSDRYFQVWSALSGCKDKRESVEHTSTGWSRCSNRSTAMITEIENEIASINRDLVYVQGETVLSLDDDHLRMSSRSVQSSSNLQQLKTPQKGLGPVGNALCSAMNSFFIACHFSRKGVKLIDTWVRLAQLVQGVSTTGALRKMPDDIWAPDRGYNCSETVHFVNDVLCSNLIGTRKRDLSYPFVFGDGPITRRHKGMVVSEKGCRSVYAARKTQGGRSNSSKNIEACLYRESCSGRIAAFIHNNNRIFKSRVFTIVLKDNFRLDSSVDELISLQDLYTAPTRRGTDNGLTDHATSTVSTHLSKVLMLTILQSEDPIWFILRAFRFTSRTSHVFLAAIATDYDRRTEGLAWMLRGKALLEGTHPLPEQVEEVATRIKQKWISTLEFLGARTGTIASSSPGTQLVSNLQGWSRSRLLQNTRQYLRDMLTGLGSSSQESWTKSQLADELESVKNKIADGSFALSNPPSTSPDVSTPQTKGKKTRTALSQASVGAWIVKPLVATQGMREGSWNEVHVLQAIPSFFEARPNAFSKILGRLNTYGVTSIHYLDLKHVRAVGLIESKGSEMIADSPDAVASGINECGETIAFAVEVKTMTADTSIEKAKQIREKYSLFIVLEDLYYSDMERKFFHEIVPEVDYRTQVVHHAVTLGVSSVLYVCATGGSMCEGHILYCCVLKFNDLLRHSYSFCLDCVRASSFEWVGGEPSQIPKDYDAMLNTSQASDLISFASYYSLRLAVRRLIEKRNMPLPPTRMIRLAPTVFWNQMKGGVDVMSRHLKTLARTNQAEHPIFSIIARMISMQVNNAAIAYRLYTARKLKVLPTTCSEDNMRGYDAVRHKVSQLNSLGRFSRMFASEWLDTWKSKRSSAVEHDSESLIAPRFKRKVVEKFNRGAAQVLRLRDPASHRGRRK